MLKKLSVIFVVYMMLITGSLINVSAEENNYYEYVLENNEAIITSYKGNEKNLKIPEEINGYKVTKIESSFQALKRSEGGNYYSSYEIDSLTLPSTLKEIKISNDQMTNGFFSEINSITFDRINDNFFIEDGCLYNKERSILYFIPIGISNLSIKSETTEISFANLSRTNITKLSIPNSVKKIYGYGLNLPKSLKELDIDMSYTGSIYSSSLKKLSFGENIIDLSRTSISCGNLEELNFSNNLKIMPYIYSESLKIINIPSSVENIENLSNSHLENLETISVDKNNKSIKSIDGVLYQNTTLVFYPSGKKDETYIVPEGITEIKAINNEYLKNLTLPDSLTNIGVRGLAYCESLETFNIPQNITTFYEDDKWDYALMGCNNLQDITVDEKNQYYKESNGALYSKDYTTLYKWFDRNTKNPNINNKTTKISISAFDSCDNVETIDLKNVTDVVYGAFTNCKNLENVDFSKVQTIGAYGFMNCTSLKKANLPESLSKVNLCAFANCEDLESVHIPQNLNDIYETDYDNYIFRNCDNLSKITVNEKNEKYVIDSNAFYSKDYKTFIKQLDRKVEDITLRDETEIISATAFINCKNLKSINTNNVTTIMYGGFANCDKLKKVLIPNVTDLKGCVFASCNSLISFKMPDTLKRLNSSGLFANCESLVDVDLNKITYFNIQAVAGCPSLKCVVIPKTVEELTTGYWDGFDTISKLFVYRGSSAQKFIENNNKNAELYGYNKKIDYAIINEYENEDSNVKVQLGASNIDESTELKVSQLKEGNDYDEVSKSFENFDLYDIGFYKDNEKVEIDGTAIVKIPVKEGMNENKCKVYYNDNGTYTDMNAVYKDGCMEFKTDHFSQYVLTDNELPTTSLGDVNGDGEINFLDAIMVLRHDAEIIELEENQLKAADVNKDGEVNFLDAIMILRYDAEIIDSF